MIVLLLRCLTAFAIAALINIFYSLYTVRMHVRRVKTKYGCEILPHSFIFGHLLVIYQVLQKSKVPHDTHSQWLPLLFLQEYPEIAKKGILYLDVWPISEPLLAIYEPDMLTQVSDGNFKKSPLMLMELGPVTGGTDILTAEGAQWKRARGMFNPGFSARNLTSLIPQFVDDVAVFRSKLKQAASTGETIKLEDWTTSLAVDVIGRAVLGINLNCQVNHPPLIETMQTQVPLLYNKLDLYKAFNPMRYFKLWLYRRRFRAQLMPYIEDRVRNHADDPSGAKTILRLALKERAKEVQDLGTQLDLDAFIEEQVGQFWIFLFAGHDTTAITLSYSLYLLSCHPEKAALLREEHDRVLGTDPSQAADRFRNDPSLVNQLPYTAAVYKEALRLFPPVTGGVRSPTTGFFVTHPETGERFPTWGFMVNSAGAILHRLPHLWPEPNTFLPERWLVKDPSDPMYPRKGIYRPFDAGARNCIGQEMVAIETKLFLAMIAREFEVKDTYPRDDGLSFLGERAYQVDLPESVVTSHARDRMPVKVFAR